MNNVLHKIFKSSLFSIFCVLHSSAVAADDVCIKTETHEREEICEKLKKNVKEEQSNFPTGSLQDIEIVKKQLQLMYDTDQAIRHALIKERMYSGVQDIVQPMDQFHIQRMKALLQEHGWINISKFGPEADHQAWLLVQHASADPIFQAGSAFLLQELQQVGETDSKNFAYLYDRVAMRFQNIGMKQKYGTQFSITTNGVTLLPYQGTLEEVNKRRSEIGLEPIEEYLSSAKQMYG